MQARIPVIGTRVRGGRALSTPAGRGHGWWPYLGPYAAFLLVVQISGELPDAFAPWMLLVKPAVPLGLILYFALQGRYPEFREMRFRPGWLLLDIAFGVLLAILWMGPYLLFDILHRPEAEAGFNPDMAGESMRGLILGLRLFGFALVTPVFEELFIRSFVMRYADCYLRAGDFRDIPLARYTLRSFLSVVVIFTLGHAPWEYWVCVPWIALSNLWFYLRRDIGSVIVLHATTNASILVYVVVMTGGIPGGPLWVFV